MRKKSRVHSDDHGQAWDRTLARLSRLMPKIAEPTDNCVHDLRVSIKQVLAFLELIRAELPKAEYRSLRLRLKGQGAVLALYRDPVTMEQSFKCFLKLGKDEGKKAKLEREFRRSFRPRRTISQQILSNSLESMRRLVISLPPLRNPVGKVLKHGYGKTYKETRKAWLRARKSGSARDLHEWRMWTKFLFLQKELLVSSQSEITSDDKRMKQLQKCLGEHHDFANLQKFLTSKWRVPNPELLKYARCLIQCRLKQLETKVFELGGKLFQCHHP
ncbi:MAG: CHAD domain-containing protein [Verrucomicrobiota bacterium]